MRVEPAPAELPCRGEAAFAGGADQQIARTGSESLRIGQERRHGEMANPARLCDDLLAGPYVDQLKALLARRRERGHAHLEIGFLAAQLADERAAGRDAVRPPRCLEPGARERGEIEQQELARELARVLQENLEDQQRLQ